MKKYHELIEGYPPGATVTAADVRRARDAAHETTIYVVLDDDPTGTQSVADLPVLTSWEEEDFLWAYATGKPAVYVMTNSRSLSANDAERVNREVTRAALKAATTAGVTVAFVSRSDSTLRGHFPLEPQTIVDEYAAATGRKADGIVVVPAFGDAGRITVGGIHYAGSVESGFVPVGETEFAKDATFGFTSSALADWVEEKSHGQIPASSVIHIDLTALRTEGEAVPLLQSAKNGAIVVVDIVTEEDLRLLSLSLIEAEAAGSTFVYRVGPPFVRARIGQDVREPLTVREVEDSRRGTASARGGLIVVGSHVDLTTRQLNVLRDKQHPAEFEIEVAKVVDADHRDQHLAAIAQQAADALNAGNVVVRTSRTLVTGKDRDDSLDISRRVSAAVVEVVQRVLHANPPRFVVAKGGITSSDVASKGLGIRHAMVIGPMLPGIVSLWSGQDGPAAGIPYVVFAGNVGNEESLAAVVNTLSH